MIFDYVFHGERAGWFFPGAALFFICFLAIPGTASAWDCPECYEDSIISSREWSPGLLSQEFTTENLTMNTTRVRPTGPKEWILGGVSSVYTY